MNKLNPLSDFLKMLNPETEYEIGQCECADTPTGEHGLIGYIMGQTYSWASMNDAEGKKFYRIFPTENQYEIITPWVFDRYFDKIEREFKP